MDGEIFKKILKNDSEKLIIMDGGKPKFVVMSYDSYREMASGGAVNEKFEVDFNELISRNEKQSTKNSEEEIVGMNENIQGVKRSDELSLDDLPIM